MRKVLLVIIAGLLLSGCAGFIDLMLPEYSIHAGTVKAVTIGDTNSVIFFEDGMSYIIQDKVTVRPGMYVEIIQIGDEPYKARY